MPHPSVHGIFQVRIQKWGAISSSRGSSWPKDWTQTPVPPALAVGFFPTEPQGSNKLPCLNKSLFFKKDQNRLWSQMVGFRDSNLKYRYGPTWWPFPSPSSWLAPLTDEDIPSFQVLTQSSRDPLTFSQVKHSGCKLYPSRFWSIIIKKRLLAAITTISHCYPSRGQITEL